MTENENEDAPLFVRKPFTLDDVSDEIRPIVQGNFSALLRKISEQSLDAIGDKLMLHKSNVSRMKDNGELLTVAARTAAIGFDIVAMEELIAELRRQNAALQIVAEANLSLHKIGR